MDWDPDDQAKALAFLIEEGQRCQMCGTADWEWQDNKYAYEPTAKFCKGCYLKDTAQEDSQNLPGTTVILEPATAITPALREIRAEQERKRLYDELREMRRR